MEWDKIKGRGMDDDRERFSKSKQRFRAIIYKLIKGKHITELCNDKYTKIYCLGTKEGIPSDVIEKALQSRESREKSLERIYRCDPETVSDFSAGSFLVDNQSMNVMEDHKYAYRLKEVATECEVTVPDIQAEPVNSRCIQYMYIDLLTLPDKHGTVVKLEDNLLEDFNGSNCTIASDDIRWEGNLETELYRLPLDENTSQPESFLNSHDKIKKCSAIDGDQSVTFSEVWKNCQL